MHRRLVDRAHELAIDLDSALACACIVAYAQWNILAVVSVVPSGVDLMDSFFTAGSLITVALLVDLGRLYDCGLVVLLLATTRIASLDRRVALDRCIALGRKLPHQHRWFDEFAAPKLRIGDNLAKAIVPRHIWIVRMLDGT